MQRDLGIGWVIRREMEIRSRRPAWYEGFAYEGPGVPLLLLVPVLACLLARADAALTLGWMMFYDVYLMTAAAGMVGGSLATDWACARQLPVSAWSLLAGKLVGSLLNLWGEVVVVLAVFLLASPMMGPGGWQGCLLLACHLAWMVLAGGLIGAASARRSALPMEVAQRSRAWVWLLLVSLPALLSFLGAPVPDMLTVTGLVLHPMGGAFLLAGSGTIPGIDLAVATAILGMSLLFAVALGKVRCSLR